MPTSKTKELARKLGLIKKRKTSDATGNARKKRKGQLLSHVIIIDFESTCWEDKKGNQEVIEFPAVVLNLASGEVVSEFQQYVQPQEHPRLSKFCTKLTGITQAQVDNGVPLPTCIWLFNTWLRRLREEKGIELMEPGREYSEEMALSALGTWTDWDLGVCLNYECRRKQIRKPTYFNQWIDLRAVYKTFYDRTPRGLVGALEDLGITFTGREHSGLDDARNTAKLCYRLVRDGCKLNITKCIQNKTQAAVIKAPSLPQLTSSSVGETLPQAPHLTSGKEEKQDQTSLHCKISDSSNSKLMVPDTGSAESKRSVTCGSTYTSTCAQELEQFFRKNQTPKQQLKADSTASLKTEKDVGSTCKQGHALAPKLSAPDAIREAETGKEVPSFGEGVAWIEDDDDVIANIANELDKWEEVAPLNRLGGNQVTDTTERRYHRPVDIPCKDLIGNVYHTASRPSTLTTATPSRAHCITHVAPLTLLSSPGQPEAISSNCMRKNAGVFTSPFQAQPKCGYKLSMQSPSSHKPVKPVSVVNVLCNTSPEVNELFSPPFLLKTPPPLTVSPGTPAAQTGVIPIRYTETPFHISTSTPEDSHREVLSSPSSANSSDPFRTPSALQWMKLKKISQLPHTPNSSSRDPLVSINGRKVTPPLCNCGKRARRKLVSNPGPNEGKPFYACPRGRGSDGGKGCGFFRWEQSAVSSPNSTCSSLHTTGYSSPEIFSEYSD